MRYHNSCRSHNFTVWRKKRKVERIIHTVTMKLILNRKCENSYLKKRSIIDRFSIWFAITTSMSRHSSTWFLIRIWYILVNVRIFMSLGFYQLLLYLPLSYNLLWSSFLSCIHSSSSWAPDTALENSPFPVGAGEHANTPSPGSRWSVCQPSLAPLTISPANTQNFSFKDFYHRKIVSNFWMLLTCSSACIVMKSHLLARFFFKLLKASSS